MKSRSILFFAALFSLLFSIAAVAAPNRKTIQLTDPVLVGNITLKPGEYTAQWTLPGPDVQVTFSQGNKTLVTVPATLEMTRNPRVLSITYQTGASGDRSFMRIELRDATLQFGPREASGVN
jgi:hypothetical protein